MHPPQIVVSEFFRCGLLEGGDLDSLRVGAIEYMADGAILASRVHRLEHDQHLVLALGVEDLLQ